MRPVGPAVDADPRPRPEQVVLRGHYVTLEPGSITHRPELWRTQQDADPATMADSFAYLGYGPFTAEAAFNHWFGGFSAREDHAVWVVRPSLQKAAGWLTLMDIQTANASIEMGSIWLAPPLQRTRAATETFFLAMTYALETLGNRRLTWKCNALNAPSRRAALRLGFSFEGILRNHMIVKGHSRDTAYFSIIAEEWGDVARALRSWLEPDNFDAAGRQIASVEAIRAKLAPVT